ncbi:hypothetical protein LB507_005474 [Fusarium sp. FIESC RH6]|nr:hypothetical protein LB507_005474 [Fusarium sp. FIESC RH6]
MLAYDYSPSHHCLPATVINSGKAVQAHRNMRKGLANEKVVVNVNSCVASLVASTPSIHKGQTQVESVGSHSPLVTRESRVDTSVDHRSFFLVGPAAPRLCIKRCRHGVDDHAAPAFEGFAHQPCRQIRQADVKLVAPAVDRGALLEVALMCMEGCECRFADVACERRRYVWVGAFGSAMDGKVQAKRTAILRCMVANATWEW